MINKIAIITGSSGGIGKALLSESINRGYIPFGFDIVEDKKFGLIEDHKEIIKDLATKGEIKILINNAGIVRLSSIKDSDVMTKGKELMDSNFYGMINLCNEVLQVMKEGSIVNVASIASHVAFPSLLHYCASKGAVVSASRQMALDLAPNIRVNSVSPGIIDTPMSKGVDQEIIEKIALKRIGKPEEVAKFIFDIAENEYITGQDFIIDGGYVLL